MPTKMLLGSLVVATALVGLEGTASAEPRQEDTYGTVSGQLNYGISTGDNCSSGVCGPDLNPFGFGLGARGGVTFGPGVYIGADFDYFFGEKQSAGIAGVGASVTGNIYSLAEIGYDAWIYRQGVLRPKIGLGVGWAHVNGCAGGSVLGLVNFNGCDSRTTDGFDVAPGLQFLHFFGAGFLTAELRYETILVDGPNPSAVVLSLGGGAGF
jgi:hypothetical protein